MEAVSVSVFSTYLKFRLIHLVIISNKQTKMIMSQMSQTKNAGTPVHRICPEGFHFEMFVFCFFNLD